MRPEICLSGVLSGLQKQCDQSHEHINAFGTHISSKPVALLHDEILPPRSTDDDDGVLRTSESVVGEKLKEAEFLPEWD